MEIDSNATRVEEEPNLGRKRNDDASDDENVEKNDYEETSTDVDVEVPRIGMIFASQQETRCYYEKYAYQKGFSVRKISTKRNTDGQSSYYSLACVKGGKQKSTARSRCISRPSIKTDCKAKINVIVDADGQCTISRVLLDHNHALSPKISRFERSCRKLGPYSKRRAELNDQASIPSNKDLRFSASEVGKSENLALGEKDCGNYIAEVGQLRLRIGDAEALCNYFVRMRRRNSNFFYVIDMDEEGRLRNVFWADARSRAAYESFGDVLFFDTIYLKSKYDVPLTTFVGVNRHGQSILFGCGLLTREDVGAYVWLFRSWLECMHGRPPNAIITDQCEMTQAAVAEVFPSSHHRLCLWHIMKKLPEKLGGLTQYKVIEKILKGAVYESLNPEEFEESWSKMIEDFNVEKNEWLRSLFVDRRRWVPIYVKKVFWAGLSTTQINESVDAFFYDYVSSKTSLKQFVEQYDNALKSKVEKENKADYCSFNSTYKSVTDFYFEKQFHESYTNDVFRLFQDELRGLLYCNCELDKVDGFISSFNVTDILRGMEGKSKQRVVFNVCYNEAEFDVQCSCNMFESKGILCRHIVKILIEKDVKEIPSHYILARWRKDLKRRYCYVVNCYDDQQTSEDNLQFDGLCTNFYEAAEIAASSSEKYEFFMRYIDEGKKRLKDDFVLHNCHFSLKQ